MDGYIRQYKNVRLNWEHAASKRRRRPVKNSELRLMVNEAPPISTHGK